ncbi:hypothetical protein WOLCODRAFT_159476 [Wolfiporia cocos MD-104 SS10]|uniref:Secreted protein n=1 Tax=Wolfiporia cocos (strain MD-104) TaxID=742152 RepID=A0A2H3JJM4_WOLCO|nr:hypothetical protein WOLCODRAFT_159476 [Wolfiporia cocos MD-104 SS10]
MGVDYVALAPVLVLLLLHAAAQRQLAQLVSYYHSYAIAVPRVYSEVSLGATLHKPAIAAQCQLTHICIAVLADTSCIPRLSDARAG